MTIDDIKSTISEELLKFETFYRDALHSDNFLLDRIGRYTLRHKGKQMRPIFVFLCAKCFGDVNVSTYRAATFIELLHSATLIHDDVVDDAAERRGFASINALYKNKIAVLAGDYLLSKGMMIALEKHDYEMLDMISDTVKKMSEGEIFQLEKAKKMSITEDDYYQIIEKKTASMIGSCCAIGAVSAGAAPAQVAAMRKFGVLAGTAFQIRDDIFDYQPDNHSGKGYGNDIREHKMTLPLIHLLKESTPIERTLIISKIRLSGNKKRTVDYIIRKANEINSLNYCEERMYYFAQQAENQLDMINDCEAKESLRKLLYYCIKREI